MEMTCMICGFRGDKDLFRPDAMDEEFGPDWVCPKCKCGGYSPATLFEDFFEYAEVESVL